MCLCGNHPQGFVNMSPSLSTMTTHKLMELLQDMEHTVCEIRDDGIGIIGITTARYVSITQREKIKNCMPAGVLVNFVVKDDFKRQIPKQLEKWYRETKRYLK